MPCSFTYEDETCQFDVAESNLLTLPEGTAWCKFHCPMTNNESRPGSKADWSDNEISIFNQDIISLIQHNQEDTINLTGVVFPSDFNCPESILPAIDLKAAFFSGDALFNKTKFSGGARFSEAIFNGDAGFNKSQFTSYAEFNKTKFSGDTGFNKAQFKNYTEFIGTRFCSDVEFNKAQFNDNVAFNETKFNCLARFNNTLFVADAVFDKAQFGGYAVFYKAEFEGNVVFDNAQFCDITEFIEARFNFDASFEGGEEQIDNDGIISNSFSYLSFRKAQFLGIATFSNRIFKKITDFKYCEFDKSPKFHNCELHQDTDFTSAVFRDTKSKSAARDYRTLKLAMEQHRARAEQTNFYALEQKSLRDQPDYSKTKYWLSLLYEITCDYGRSVTIPFIWLLMFIILAFSFNIAVVKEDRMSKLGTVFSLTIKQTVKPFEALSKYGEETVNIIYKDKTWLIQITSFFQSIISIVLITLIVLSIRWEFRKG